MSSGDGIRFLRAAVRNPLRVGAIAPSSKALAKRMVKGIDFRPGHAVLEFGPGTGPFTRHLKDVLADHGTYLGIERDDHFVRMLSERFPTMRVVHGSAEHAEQHLRDAGHEKVQAIISGLPFASLPVVVQDGVVDCLDRLMQPGTVFRTFQYVHAWPLPAASRFRQRMAKLFGDVEVSRPVMWNLPPAVVLSWKR